MAGPRRESSAIASHGLAGFGIAAALVACCAVFPFIAALAGGVAVGTILGIGAGVVAGAVVLALVAASLRSRTRERSIGPAGSVARLVVGSLAVGAGLALGPAWWEVLLGLLALPALALLTALVAARLNVGDRLAPGGHAGFCLNVAAVAVLLLIPATQLAALLWLGVSMWVGALRGNAGCETTAISNWLLRRDDQVGCVLFGPLDRIEAQSQRP